MRIHRLHSLLLAAAIVVGCSKHEGAPAPAGSSSSSVTSSSASPGVAAPAMAAAPATAASPVAKFSGTLTPDVIKKANLTIDIYTPTGQHAPIADCLAQAKARLGEPTRVEKSTYTWGVTSADNCTCYTIADQDGKAYSDGVVSADFNGGKNAAFGECLAKLGKKPGKP